MYNKSQQLQGGTGPGGCDALHYRDVLLRYGTFSAHLSDSAAGLCHDLCNFIVPWDSFRALVASHLIALNKCPGVRPIAIGDILCRIIRRLCVWLLPLMLLWSVAQANCVQAFRLVLRGPFMV